MTRCVRRAGGRRASRGGFTIVELAIAAAIVGILAAVAIPIFLRHQLTAKTAEARTNLGSLRVAEGAYFTEHDVYRAAAPEPALIPGAVQDDFDTAGSDFASLGWSPEGRVYFSYAVAVSADATGYTADAGADIDADGIVQLWGYAMPDTSGALVNGEIGCDTVFLVPSEIGRCGDDPSIY